MNKEKSWVAIRGSVAKTPAELELSAIRNLVIPLTYIRINSLIQKILSNHC